VKSVEVATAGVGIGGLMGNKGAVGVRVTLVEPEAEKGEKTSVWTFVSAHFAAHASQKHLERRNADWKSVVERLVFVDDAGREKQLFDSGNVFFFGVSSLSILLFDTY
jgi:phosphatidylinositol-bisphosphatase